jgi:hypothetical protein
LDSEKYIETGFALAIGLSIGFPMFGVLTTHFFGHRHERVWKFRTVAFWCVTWMSIVGLMGLTFGWYDGLIRYSGESLNLLTVQREETQILKKDIHRTRGSGSTRYWLTLSNPDQEEVRVSKLYFDSVSVNQVVTIANAGYPKIYWPVEDSFSLNKLANFLFCYSLIVFLSCGFFAFAWIPESVYNFLLKKM